MLRLAILTTGRQDWGILRTICRLARASTAIDLELIAGGMALSAAHGASVRSMEEEGLAPDARLDWLNDTGTNGAELAVHLEAAKALSMVGDALTRTQPDALLVAGDRSETMAAAMAATLLRIPIVHLHGGEESAGAFDNALRHAITKLSHLHLVSHPSYARRVLAMGEDPRTVHVVGAPGLDSLFMTTTKIASRSELEARLGLALEPPVVVVTLHPATLGADPAVEAACLCEVMDRVKATYVVTLPNNDPGSAVVRELLTEAAKKPRRVAVEALGAHYWALMTHADAMLGNSSSALIEAPALALPAVNVGARQRGRLRGPNVIDVEGESSAVTTALERALDAGFRSSIGEASRALYGAGGASKRAIEILERWTPPRPPIKSTFG